ncbi:hypothetical protein JJE65_09295 [Alloprevotella tannerae]|uniref:hypothetical protein n=1 Tax=Alloprevotella tannerae TaxID=76122 RepID=UPI001EDBC5B2|nr:hypothetical protein [Alloprevotella tannerae]MCG2649578.1 hypothetical protein [Alloprevotella tannerae]
MNDYTTFSYGKITEKVYLTDGFLMLFEFYSQDFVVCTPAVTVWISFYLAKVASPPERHSIAALFCDILMAPFHKSKIWVECMGLLLRNNQFLSLLIALSFTS